MRANLICLLLAVFSVQEVKGNRKCFSCRNIRFPSDCTNVEVCGQNQDCYIEEESSGNYNTGCRNVTDCETGTTFVGKRQNEREANPNLCIECCEGDYCNAYGCKLLKYECFRKINLGYFYDSTSNTCTNVVKANGQLLNQSEAIHQCQSEGANLVSIRSEAQQQFLLSWIYTHHRNTTEFWVGLMANVSGSHIYYWPSGDSPTYAYWGTSMTGQPTDRINKDENCVFLNSKDGLNWFDDTCSAIKKGLICEIKSSNLEESCRRRVFQGYMYDRSSYTCIRLVVSPSNGYNYQMAETICKHDHAKLVQINTKAKMDFLFWWIYSNKANSSDFWIGAKDRSNKGNFTWPDGTPVVYNRWGGPEFAPPPHNQPDEQYYHIYNQRCIYLSVHGPGFWYDDRCDSLKHGHVCQFRGKNDRETEDGCYRLLSNGYFFDYRTKLCVAIIDGSGLNRDDAELQCRTLNSSLIQINSENQTTFMTNLIYSLRKNGTEFWIGGKDLYKNGTFYWEQSRQPFTYTHWHNVNMQEAQDCVILNRTDNFRWYPEICSVRKKGYICEINKETIVGESIATYMRLHSSVVSSTKSITSATAIKSKSTTVTTTQRPTQLPLTTQTKQFPTARIETTHFPESSTRSSVTTITVTKSTPSTTSVTPGRTPSPDGYLDISNRSTSSVCIKVNMRPQIYPDAKQICEADNATLLFPESADMMADVQAYLSIYYRGIVSFYLGLVSYGHDGIFTSLQREPVLYTDWLNGEPSRGSICVRANQNEGYKWQAIKCVYNLPFICQRRISCK